MSSFYIGGDLGTSSLKLVLVDETGAILSEVVKEYQSFHPFPAASEQRPEDWENALFSGLEELVPEARKRRLVKGICIDGQMHGLVLLDKDGKPLRNAILWNDNRATEEVEFLNNEIGKDVLLKETANIAYPGFTLPKLLWVKKHEPEIYSKIAHVLLPKDYLNYALTAHYHSEPSDACGTLYYNPTTGEYSEKLLALTGLPLDAFPKIIPSGEITGHLRPEPVDKLGFLPECFVLGGAGDNAAAALGVGVSKEGSANLSLGTSGTLFMPTNKVLHHKDGAIHSFDSALGTHGFLSCMLSAASSLSWLHRNVYGNHDFEAEQAKIPSELLGNNNLYYLPYLTGERSPIGDPNAKGCFIGLTSTTARPEMTLAVLEGVSFAMRESLEEVRKTGIEITESCITGGGSKSPLWLVVMASVLNVKLNVVSSRFGPSYGMALLAMVKDGIYKDYEEAKAKNLKIKKVIEPDEKLVALYDKKYEVWHSLYPVLKPLFPKMQ